MLEATLTLILFLSLVLGLFDFGFALFLHQTFVNRARQGARYGAVNPGDLNAIKNIVLYGQTAGSGNGVMGLAPSSVAVTRQGTPGGTDDRIVVTISGYTFTFLTPGYAGRKNGNTITITMPVEN